MWCKFSVSCAAANISCNFYKFEFFHMNGFWKSPWCSLYDWMQTNYWLKLKRPCTQAMQEWTLMTLCGSKPIHTVRQWYTWEPNQGLTSLTSWATNAPKHGYYKSNRIKCWLVSGPQIPTDALPHLTTIIYHESCDIQCWHALCMVKSPHQRTKSHILHSPHSLDCLILQRHSLDIKLVVPSRGCNTSWHTVSYSKGVIGVGRRLKLSKHWAQHPCTCQVFESNNKYIKQQRNAGTDNAESSHECINVSMLRSNYTQAWHRGCCEWSRRRLCMMALCIVRRYGRRSRELSQVKVDPFKLMRRNQRLGICPKAVMPPAL